MHATDLAENTVFLFLLCEARVENQWIVMDKRNGDLYKCFIRNAPYYDTRDFNMPRFEAVSYDELSALADQAPQESVTVGRHICSPKPYRGMTKDTWKRGYKIAIHSLVPGRPQGEIKVLQVVSEEEDPDAGRCFSFEKKIARTEIVIAGQAKFSRRISYNCTAGANTRPEYMLREEYYRILQKDGAEYTQDEPAFIYTEQGTGALY